MPTLNLKSVGLVLALLLPPDAVAGPMFGVPLLEPGEVLVVSPHFALTDGDLLILEARHDNGWHLGWFRRESQQAGDDAPELPFASDPSDLERPFASDASDMTTLDELAESVWSLVFDPLLLSLAPTLGASLAEDHVPVEVGVLQAIPEPAMVLLLGTGLMVAGRRHIGRRPG